jgi:hypothetical protein
MSIRLGLPAELDSAFQNHIQQLWDRRILDVPTMTDYLATHDIDKLCYCVVISCSPPFVDSPFATGIIEKNLGGLRGLLSGEHLSATERSRLAVCV